MAIETAKRDPNRVTVMLGITNDSSEYPTEVRIDPTTLRLLTSSSVTANALTSTPICGQLKISGAPQQLPSNSLPNGLILTAKSTNSGSVIVGTSNAVTTTEDGTGNGTILEKGGSLSWAVSNTNQLWVIGTSGDVLSYSGS